MLKIHKNKGFSLVELMVTILILLILAAIAMSLYSNYMQKTLVSNEISGLGSIKAHVSEKLSQDDNDFSGMTYGEGITIEADGTILSSISGSSLVVILKPSVI
ncbi:MAG: prepilin-type N-terminal cleavage/methylation domain-containing protein [Psychroserpens sp.]|jgi:prepilin-type N-terminal cleavage/methylation domain-containing protein